MKIGECFEKAWNTFNKTPLPFILAAIVMLVSSGVLGWLSNHFWGIAIVEYVVMAFLNGGLTYMAIRAHRGALVELPQVFSPLERPVPYLVVSIAILSGAVFCGIGILVTAFLFFYATIYVARGDDFGVALGKSKDMAMRHPGETMLIGTVELALYIAGFLAFGVGLVLAIPVGYLFVVEALDRMERIDEGLYLSERG